MLLSVLSLSLPSRCQEFLARISAAFDRQMEPFDDVEFLCLLDNQRMSVGEKWNVLLRAARGQFITCMGDDDMPADGYVSELRKAILEHSDVDVIVFDEAMFRSGSQIATVKWGIEYENRDDWDNKKLYRFPGEKMAIRSEIRKRYEYPDVWRGSDWRMLRKIMHAEALQSQYRIPHTLYNYYTRPDNDAHIRKQREVNRAKHARGERLVTSEAV